MEEIKTYYRKLAESYDSDRFGGSYGQYIHQQEFDLLSRWLNKSNDEAVLDLACGTGRLSMFASHGLDQSSEMIRLAKEKHRDLEFQIGDASDTGFSPNQFELVFSFHFIMHLQEDIFRNVLKEIYRLLKPGGRFIFDFPSKNRRALTTRKPSGWHGDYALNLKELQYLLGDQWMIRKYEGILALPIHRIPSRMRKIFIKFDHWCCRSIFRKYASYLVVEIEKR